MSKVIILVGGKIYKAKEISRREPWGDDREIINLDKVQEEKCASCSDKKKCDSCFHLHPYGCSCDECERKRKNDAWEEVAQVQRNRRETGETSVNPAPEEEFVDLFVDDIPSAE